MRALIAMVSTLWLGACAAQSQGGPILAVAQAFGVTEPNCAAQPGLQQKYIAQANCPGATRIARSRSDVRTIEAPTPIENIHPVAFSVSGRTALPRANGILKAEAMANGVPTLNIAASCRDADDVGADRNVNRCVLDEGSAREQLVHRWTEFPAADRSHCTRYSHQSGGGTYTDLLTCLEMDLHASELRGRKQYQKDEAAN